jgi:serine/threonine protein kinase/WD40 repeat protein
MSMSEQPCPSADALSSFVLGVLSESSLERIARHLDACKACEAAVAALEVLSDPVIAGLRRHPSGVVTSASSGVGSWAPGRRPTPPPLPERLGDYRILREIGRGGMGVVYEAEQVSLGRRVALKVLPRQALLDPESVARFRREARAAAALHHTNIVQVFGTGEQDGILYFVMQLIPGTGLDALIRELKRQPRGPGSPRPRLPDTAPPSFDASLAASVRRLVAGRFVTDPSSDRGKRSAERPPQESSALPVPSSALSSSGRSYWTSVARIGMQVADALAFAHAHGIIHRDIKPSNLLLDPQGTVWVTDFGLAKAPDQENLTQSGDVIGTLRYLAPECFQGRADARSDLYSLGISVYELLTLRGAFSATDRNQLLLQVLNQEPPRPGRVNPEVPRDLETIVLKAIAKDPGQRYQTAADLAADLRRFVEDRPVRARRITLPERLWRWCRRDPRTAGLLAALLLVGLVGLVGVFSQWWRAERNAAEEAGARLRAEHAEEEARESLYLGGISQARLEWRLNNTNGADRLLEETEPGRRGWEWRYLRGVQHPELATLIDPAVNLVATLAFSPVPLGSPEAGRNSPRLLAFSGFDAYHRTASTPIEVWDLTTGRRLHTLAGPSAVCSVALSPGGRFLAASHADKDARVWDVASGKQLHAWEQGGRLAFSPDGKLLAVSTPGGVVLREVAGGAAVQTVPGHGGRVAFSPDGSLLAVSSLAGVEVRDVRTGTELRRLPHGPDGKPTLQDPYFAEEGPALAFSPDGAHLVVATSPPRLWEVATGRLLHTLSGHAGLVTGADFSPDGRQVVTCGTDGTVRLWEIQGGSELLVLRGHRGWVRSVAFHPDGWCVASGGFQPGEVKLWDLTRHPEYLTLTHGTPQAIAFDPDGGRLHQLGIEGWLDDRDLPGAKRLGARIDLLNIAEKEKWTTPANLAVFSPDCRRVATVTNDRRTVKLWDVASGRELADLGALPHRTVHLAFSRDGRRLAAADWPGIKGGERTVRVWDVLSAAVLADFTFTAQAKQYFHGAVALSPDGSRVAFDEDTEQQAADGSLTRRTWVRVHDVPDRREVLRLPAGAGDIRSVTWSDDGALLAAGGAGKTFVWDSGGRVLTPDGLEGQIYRLAFSPDGRRLAGVNREEVLLWDVAVGKEVLTLRGTPPRQTDGGFNPALAWSPDGRWLAATNWQGNVNAWDGAEPRAGKPAETAADFVTLPVPPPRVTAWHLTQAGAALAGRQPAAAAFHLDRVREDELPDFWSQAERGHLLAQAGAWDRAAADLARLFGRPGPYPAEAWRDYARVLVLRGDAAGYRRLYERFVAEATAEDEGTRVWKALLAGLAPGGDTAAAVRVAEEALAAHRGHANLTLALGRALYRAGQGRQAVTRLEECLDREPQTAWLKWPWLALAQHQAGHAEEARRWFDQAAAKRKQVTARLAEPAAGLALDEGWPEFEIGYREAAAVLGTGKP